MEKNLLRFAITGIVGEILYFISLTLFLASKTEWALTSWEIMTVVGAIIMLIVLTALSEKTAIKSVCRTFMLISLSGTVFITAAAHFTSIGVVRPLVSQGKNIPEYFRIGFSPSLEMTLDYVAWGFFMGLAFLALFFGVKDKPLKIISVICGILCLSGFIGSFFSENLWYFAPLGYGFGFLIMCIYILRKIQSN